MGGNQAPPPKGQEIKNPPEVQAANQDEWNEPPQPSPKAEHKGQLSSLPACFLLFLLFLLFCLFFSVLFWGIHKGLEK